MIRMWYGNGMGGWGFALMMLSNLLLLALLLGAGVLVYRSLRRDDSAGRADAPQRLLAERYARGEIDDEEYRRRLETLRRS